MVEKALWGSTSTEDFEIQWMGRPGTEVFKQIEVVENHLLWQLDGKMFVQGKERVIAVDAYNGKVFWSKEIPGLVKQYELYYHDCSNWAADANYVFMQL